MILVVPYIIIQTRFFRIRVSMMNPNLSPHPTWNIILISLGLIGSVTIFIIMPLSYILIARSFDKVFTLKNCTIEKGIWIYSAGFRLWFYVLGIILQPYRYRKIKNKLFSSIVKKRFKYQDIVLGKAVDLRVHASKWQVGLAKVMVIGNAIFILWIVLFMLHDFVLFPEVG